MSEGSEAEFLSKEQLAAIGSPVRSELLSVLMLRGPSTVAELAKQLGKSPKGLYYHLRELERVGLATSEIRRGESGREEALYQMSRQRLRVNLMEGREYREEVKRGARMILRLTEREHNRWVDALENHPEWRGKGSLVRGRMRVPYDVAAEAVSRMEEVMKYLRDNEAPNGLIVSALFTLFPAEDVADD